MWLYHFQIKRFPSEARDRRLARHLFKLFRAGRIFKNIWQVAVAIKLLLIAGTINTLNTYFHSYLH